MLKTITATNPNLPKLAQQHLGDTRQWLRIANANGLLEPNPRGTFNLVIPAAADDDGLDDILASVAPLALPLPSDSTPLVLQPVAPAFDVTTQLTASLIVAALGYTPASVGEGGGGTLVLTASGIESALGFTPLSTAAAAGFLAVDGSGNVHVTGSLTVGGQRVLTVADLPLASNASSTPGVTSITVTGDASGTASGSSAVTLAMTLASTGVAPGAYGNVTVDGKGRVTSGRALSASDISAALTYTPTAPLGYTPANRAGDTFSGPVVVRTGVSTANSALLTVAPTDGAGRPTFVLGRYSGAPQGDLYDESPLDLGGMDLGTYNGGGIDLSVSDASGTSSLRVSAPLTWVTQAMVVDAPLYASTPNANAASSQVATTAWVANKVAAVASGVSGALTANGATTPGHLAVWDASTNALRDGGPIPSAGSSLGGLAVPGLNGVDVDASPYNNLVITQPNGVNELGACLDLHATGSAIGSGRGGHDFDARVWVDTNGVLHLTPGTNNYTDPFYVDSLGNVTMQGTLKVSMNNATGGGIVLSDDGDIVDQNTGYADMRFSLGVRVFSGNRSGTASVYLKQSGEIVSQNPATGLGRLTLNAGGSGSRSWTLSSYGQDQGGGAGWFALADETAGSVRLYIAADGIVRANFGLAGQTVDGYGFGVRAIASASSGNAIFQAVNAAQNTELGSIRYDSNSQLHVNIAGVEMIGLNASRGLYLNPADQNVALRFKAGGAAYIQDDGGTTVATIADNQHTTYVPIIRANNGSYLFAQSDGFTQLATPPPGGNSYPYAGIYSPSTDLSLRSSTGQVQVQNNGGGDAQLNVAYIGGGGAHYNALTVVRQDGADEGGELHLQAPVNSYGMGGDVVLDVWRSILRFWTPGTTNGATNRGAYIDMNRAQHDISTDLLCGGYYQAPTSTYIRSTADKLNDFVSITDYIANPGNVRSDTDALGYAMSAAYNRGPGARIYIPPRSTLYQWDGETISNIISSGRGVEIFGVPYASRIQATQTPTSRNRAFSIQDGGVKLSGLAFYDYTHTLSNNGQWMMELYGAQDGSGNSGVPWRTVLQDIYIEGTKFGITHNGAQNTLVQRLHTFNVDYAYYIETGGIDCTLQDSILYNAQYGVYGNTPYAGQDVSHTEGFHCNTVKVLCPAPTYGGVPSAFKFNEGLWIRLTNCEGLQLANGGIGLDLQVSSGHGTVMVQDIGSYWEGGANGACIKISGNAQRFRKIGGFLSNATKSNVAPIYMTDGQGTVDIDCEAAPLLGTSWAQGYCSANTSYSNRLRVVPYPGDPAPPISCNFGYSTS